MDLESFAKTIFEQINNGRDKLQITTLPDIDEASNANNVNFDLVSFSVVKSEHEDLETTTATFISELEKIFSEEELEPEIKAKKNILLNKNATHLSVEVRLEEGVIFLNIRIHYHYLELDPIGPIIGGDMVLQGVVRMLYEEYAPAVVVVEKSDYLHDDYERILLINPWNMIMSKSDEETRFIIPIKIPSEYNNCFIKAKIYLDKYDLIPFDEEDESYALNNNMIYAINYIDKFTTDNIVENEVKLEIPESELNNYNSEEINKEDDNNNYNNNDNEDEKIKEEVQHEFGVNEDDVDSTEEKRIASHVVVDVKIATDYDEMISLQAEGYDLVCRLITSDGFVDDQEHLWKFFLMCTYGPPGGNGLEDIAFVKTLKSVGTLPTLAGFDLIDFDLSDAEDDYSIYCGIKTGPRPRFKDLIMISASFENELLLTDYINSFKCLYKAAPPEMASRNGGPCGILLSLTEKTRALRRSLMYGGETKSGSETKSLADDHTLESIYQTDEEIIAKFQALMEELEIEKKSLLLRNVDLQKKTAPLYYRDKLVQGQTASSRIVADVLSAENAEDANNNLNAINANLEKVNSYKDILSQIHEARNKLSKQNKEFDQLALDLQTRLDDKEFKANGIASSFQHFKKEILQKSENSRTGFKIPPVQVKQIEDRELKREEDLEKIRLKNISLRTIFRKLEKNLRAREQLAEGLHMIDFEQLKIENQTLNEKIEERSEELGKLKRKKTVTVQILTHLREKLRFLEKVNSVDREKLHELEHSMTKMRNTVTIDKLNRDAIRLENKDLKAKQGFATSDLLLVDFEQRNAKLESLRATVDELKQRYQILMQQTNPAKQWKFNDEESKV